MDRRLPHAQLFSGQRHEVVHAASYGLLLHTRQRWHFIVVHSDQELANAAMGHVSLSQVAVEHLLAGDAEPALESVSWVVDASMNYA